MKTKTKELNKNIGLMLSVLALLDVAISVVIIFLVGVRVYDHQTVDYGFVWFTVITGAISLAYLLRKHKPCIR